MILYTFDFIYFYTLITKVILLLSVKLNNRYISQKKSVSFNSNKNILRALLCNRFIQIYARHECIMSFPFNLLMTFFQSTD